MSYSILLALSVLLCIFIYLLSAAKKDPGRALFTAGAAALSGLFFARLVFVLSDLDFFIGRTHDALSFFWLTDGGFSLLGAVAGVFIALLITGKSSGGRALRDAASVPLLLFCACSRVLEWTCHRMNFGAETNALPALLTVADEYGTKLNVALIEGALIVLVISFLLARAGRIKGKLVPFENALFMLGLVETLSISLRRDSYMMWGFVHVEQLGFFLLTAIVIMLASSKTGSWLRGFFIALFTAGLIVFLEFALDGRIHVPFAFLKDWADLFWYFLFMHVLAGYALCYFHISKRAERDQNR